jgi:hypothetical protein
MSHDVILTDDDGVRWSRDNLSTNAWLRGHFPGAEAFHQKLLERARRLFDDGKYDEAKTLRELSIAVLRELQPELDRAVAQHKQNYPTQISDEEP